MCMACRPHVTFERAPQGTRVDSGVRQGDTISPFYDSMVAKLIVHGATRAEALARMDAALAQTHIVGLATNVQFLRHVTTSASFAQAQLDTALIPREAAALFHQDKVGLPLAAAALVAHTLQAEQTRAAQKDANGWQDPWAQRDGWKSHGAQVRSFTVEYAGAPARCVADECARWRFATDRGWRELAAAVGRARRCAGYFARKCACHWSIYTEKAM